MKVSIVFPNSLCLPNQIYMSLPLLAGALTRAGHETRVVDMNVLGAELLLDDARAAHYLGLARQYIAANEAAGHLELANQYRQMIAAVESKVLDGERCKHVLRSSQDYYDQPMFKRAFWTVVDVLGFYYQLDPIISPHRSNFGRDMIAHQEADPWSPLKDLYEQGFLDPVFEISPGLVAVSLAFPEQAAESVRLARKIRERDPGVHICLGGPLVSLYADKWFEDDWIFRYFDTVCIGDGETAITELVEHLEGKRSIEQVRNLVWLSPDGKRVHNTPTPYLEAMDDLPLPEYDTADLDLYLTPRPIFPLMASRGCYWGRCTFCSIGWRENYRASSPKRIREELHHLVSRYSARYIQMQDSSVPPSSARSIAKIIKEDGLDVFWGGGMKFERCFVDEDYCRDLGEGRCVSLLMGFESANQGVLDLMDKGYLLENCETMLRNLRTAGVSVEMLWFIGFPTEERRDVLATAQYLYDRRHLFGLTAFVGDYLLHPDTIVFEQPEKFGVTVLGIENDHCHYVVAKGIQPDEARQLKAMLASNNNRTLVCSGSQIPHLAEGGLDLSGLERPMQIPAEVRQFCNLET